jgi:hypothetical protein
MKQVWKVLAQGEGGTAGGVGRLCCLRDVQEALLRAITMARAKARVSTTEIREVVLTRRSRDRLGS